MSLPRKNVLAFDFDVATIQAGFACGDCVVVVSNAAQIAFEDAVRPLSALKGEDNAG